MFYFPIVFRWGMGSKSLTIDQVIKLLLSFKQNRNWEEALLESVPKRKLWRNDDPRQRSRNEELRQLKRFQQKRRSLADEDVL